MNLLDIEYIKIALEKKGLPLIGETSWSENGKLVTLNNIESYKSQKDFLTRFSPEILSQVGIYIYEKNGEVLYIGKATPFKSRLRHHFLESQNKHEGAPIFWEFYFSKMLEGDGLNIHLIPLGQIDMQLSNKAKRTFYREVEIVEMMYQELYDPKFDNQFAEFRRVTKNKNPKRKAGVSDEDIIELKAAFLKTVA